MTSRTGSVGWDLRKVSELRSCLGRRRLTFGARRGLAAGARTWFGADGKVVIERLCLSLLYVEKTFNSKVIKSFVPELRNRKCFLCFGILMLYVYICALWTLWTFCVPVWICLFHIFMYGYVTVRPTSYVTSTARDIIFVGLYHLSSLIVISISLCISSLPRFNSLEYLKPINCVQTNEL